jgi:hypothetical protein
MVCFYVQEFQIGYSDRRQGAGTIIGKGVSTIAVRTGLMKSTTDIKYTIEVNVKDGKCRMRIYDLKDMPPGYSESAMEPIYARYKEGQMKKYLGTMFKE